MSWSCHMPVLSIARPEIYRRPLSVSSVRDASARLTLVHFSSLLERHLPDCFRANFQMPPSLPDVRPQLTTAGTLHIGIWPQHVGIWGDLTRRRRLFRGSCPCRPALPFHVSASFRSRTRRDLQSCSMDCARLDCRSEITLGAIVRSWPILLQKSSAIEVTGATWLWRRH